MIEFNEQVTTEDLIEADRKTMTFTPELVEKLRERHKMAIEKDCDSFDFEGVELVTSYAGYLIQHLDLKLGEDNDT